MGYMVARLDCRSEDSVWEPCGDILAKTARRLLTKDPLPHDVIAGLTCGWSAAELAHIWSEAALLAVKDNRRQIYEEDYVGGFERVSRYRNRPREARPNGRNR